MESLLRRFMSGMAGAHPQRISFDLVLSPFEAEAGVTVPLDLAELFPGSGREELVRFAIPGNRQQGDILTGTIEGRFGGSYEIEFRVVVRD